jgi:hypothetical protein
MKGLLSLAAEVEVVPVRALAPDLGLEPDQGLGPDQGLVLVLEPDLAPVLGRVTEQGLAVSAPVTALGMMARDLRTAQATARAQAQGEVVSALAMEKPSRAFYP